MASKISQSVVSRLLLWIAGRKVLGCTFTNGINDFSWMKMTSYRLLRERHSPFRRQIPDGQTSICVSASYRFILVKMPSTCLLEVLFSVSSPQLGLMCLLTISIPRH
jgi:hypothetical protein